MKKIINNILISLLFIFLSLGIFEKISIAYFHDFVILGLLVLNYKQVFRSINNKYLKFGWLFILFAGSSLIINTFGKTNEQFLIGLGYLVRWTAYFTLLSIMVDKNSAIDKNFIRRILFYYLLTLGVIGISQYIFFPDMRSMSVLGYDDHYFRSVGTIMDPNYFGLMLALGILLFISKTKSFRVLPIILLFIPFILSFSRASYLALFIGLLFLIKARNRVKIIGLAIIIFLGVLFLLPKPVGEGGNLLRSVSIQARQRSYIRAFEIIKSSPLVGIGFNYYRYEQEKKGFIPVGSLDHAASGSDNSFLFVLATTGIFGLLLFIKQGLVIWNVGSPLVTSSMAAVIIHSFFNNTIFFPWVIIWLVFIIGLEARNAVDNLD